MSEVCYCYRRAESLLQWRTDLSFLGSLFFLRGDEIHGHALEVERTFSMYGARELELTGPVSLLGLRQFVAEDGCSGVCNIEFGDWDEC